MSSHASAIPEAFLAKWQNTTNVMAGIFDVPAGLIMRVLPEQIEVLVSSDSEGNPYEADEKAQLNTGLYCETVMATRGLLHVPNALEDEHWRCNPDVALNMISYLGVPLLWPDNEVFGTICVLDSKTRNYQHRYVELLWEIKKSIERDFVLMEQKEQLEASNAELRLSMLQQEAFSLKLAQSNQDLHAALMRLTSLQDELLRSEKMAALGAVVAGISHELNTPIGNSLLAASTLQSRAADFAREMERGLTRSRMQEFVGTVEQGAGILMRSLDQAAKLVGSFKQVADEQAADGRRRFDLGEMVRNVLLELDEAISDSGDRVVCSIGPGIQMDSYPDQLGQVLTQLIANAVQHAFLPGLAGTVTIAAEQDGNGHVAITVRDDGLGIPQDNLARVFDPFFTTRMGKGGSGLGLHIVYKLVTSTLHGSVEVSSAEGAGACFTVTLPMSAPVALRKPDRAPLAPPIL
ncbi:ATP-binding protein [Pseudoduganella sp. UC29_71]|uniref:ATP-binding protein n=1 Tax=Pseudoduganella sp. UC29_71 TaxID=3350174 RepID=UPI0036702E85